ncbi:hypothetical protein ABMA27_015050 [Loxostege sticticalis]|uniref:Reverse transcriptase n=1 Tax=Loxostege sticticalis TaxID=481309 RepID=A0ABR3I693_LOXSC
MQAVRHRTILQGNLNHSRAAQDLMAQTMASWTASLAVVAEPYSIPSNWLGDLDSLVAIVPRPSTDSPPLSLIERGHGYVAAMWGDIAVMGVYFSPNRQLADFEAYLAYLAPAVARMPPGQVAVLGDLNARSTAWGDRVTKPKGRVLELWATTVGLSLLNRGNTYTCVRRRGGSIVDVSFATPALAARVRKWEVDLAVTLSDHRHIRIEIADHSSALCDASMPRSHRPPPKKAVYWWSTDLEDLRVACLGALRSFRRYRRRAQRHEEEEDRLYAAYCEAKKVLRTLRVAIAEAKAKAREEMLATLTEDPWGRPYKTVRGKLRPWAPPITETLEPALLENVVATLFPAQEDHTPPAMRPHAMASIDPPDPVSEGELGAAMLRLKAKNVAPGPDGIPGKVWVLAEEALGERLRALFTACLEQGRFPAAWKRGRLVLLKKEGRPADSPSAYRPIVLLDEVGKLLERIISVRLVQHLERVGPNLSPTQFGFRAERSTVDAILRVRELADAAVDSGGVLLAVSLDIANAFNTLPWAPKVPGAKARAARSGGGATAVRRRRSRSLEGAPGRQHSWPSHHRGNCPDTLRVGAAAARSPDVQGDPSAVGPRLLRGLPRHDRA